jgi:CHAT domain/Double zinc ribbon
MPGDKIVKQLKITVDTNDTIQVQQTLDPDMEMEPNIKINLDDLKRETIVALVNMLRENRVTTDKEFEVLGANLYSVLFTNQIGQELTKALYNDETLDYLRIELEFGDGQQELASWPWEYLYCPLRLGKGGTGYPLGRLENVVLTRHLRLGGITARSLQVEERPVRVLFVATSPEDKDLKPVQYTSVLNSIKELPSVKKGLIEVTPLVDPEFVPINGQTRSTDTPSKTTLDGFLNMVSAIAPHIIHFIGHGQCKEGCGQIFFTHPDYKPDPVKDSDLASWLLPHKSLRLVFLQACESALPDPYQAVSGVAMNLAQKNIPAVVAMQYKVQAQIANVFARAFYQALAENKTVDVAVRDGRREIPMQFRDQGKGHAYGLPVLYLRRTGALFASDVTNGQSSGRERGPQTPHMIQQEANASRNQSTATSITCPQCGILCDSDAKYCSDCGSPLLVVCPGCKVPLKRGGQSYCSNCGKPLKGQSSSDTFSRTQA